MDFAPPAKLLRDLPADARPGSLPPVAAPDAGCPGRDQLAAYRTRSLSPLEFLAVDDHLDGCADCRAAVSTPRRGQAAARSVEAALRRAAGPPAEHLTYDDLTAFVDGRLGEQRGTVAQHLEQCAACQREKDELAAFKQLIEAEAQENREVAAAAAMAPPTARHPETTPAAETASTTKAPPGNSSPTPPRGVWHRVREFWLAGVPQPRLQLAGASLAALVVGFGLANLAPALRFGSGGEPLPAAPPLPAGGGEPLPAEARAALQTGELARPAVLAQLVSAGGVPFGRRTDPDTLALRAPVGTAIRGAKPRLWWDPYDGGATGFACRVYKVGGEQVAATKAPIVATEWTAKKDLSPGLYRWHVTVQRTRGKPPLTWPAWDGPDARFLVLPRSELEALRALERRYAGRLPYAEYQLLMGVEHARRGLLDDAEKALEAAWSAAPDSAVAGRLLNQVRSWRGKPAVGAATIAAPGPVGPAPAVLAGGQERPGRSFRARRGGTVAAPPGDLCPGAPGTVVARRGANEGQGSSGCEGYHPELCCSG